MSYQLAIPPTIDCVIQDFDKKEITFTVHDVYQTLVKVRRELIQPTAKRIRRCLGRGFGVCP